MLFMSCTYTYVYVHIYIHIHMCYQVHFDVWKFLKGPHKACASQALFNRRKLIVEISLDFSGVENLGQVFEGMVVKLHAFDIFTQIKLWLWCFTALTL